jgi:hypothetical protein
MPTKFIPGLFRLQTTQAWEDSRSYKKGWRGPSGRVYNTRPKRLPWLSRLRIMYRNYFSQRHNSRTGLYRLPNELIDKICGHFEHAVDILSFAHCCRRTKYIQLGRIYYISEYSILRKRVRRDRRAEKLGGQPKNTLWCNECQDFRPQASFRLSEIEMGDDKRTCRNWAERTAKVERWCNEINSMREFY